MKLISTRAAGLLLVLALGVAVSSADTTTNVLEEDDIVEQEERHPLEAAKSWDNHIQRQRRQRRRRLKYEVAPSDPDDDEDTPYTIMHKKLKKHIPFAGGDTTHGMMIDAGSQGTRLHIFEWDKRFLLDQDDLLDVTQGKKLSIPTSNSRWTDKYLPGLDVFAYHKTHKGLRKALKKYLGPLLGFAKTILKEKQDQWHHYPIYLKATGGVRTLPKHERVRLMEAIRDLFNNNDTRYPNFNPFSFEDERARVISGEEEAIYGWVGVNFAKGTLIKDSIGSGTAMDAELTYGMLEMGGASTQIAVFENHGDLLANLFKLQLGGGRHWNVYVHSYLYFGINGAWTRLNGRLHWKGTNVNPCLPIGSDIEFDAWATMDAEGRFYPRSANESVPYNVTMINNKSYFDYDECSNLTYKLLRKKANKDWCEFEMDGSCGMGGIYQPPMPKVNAAIDEFIATSNFVDILWFLGLGGTAAVHEIGEAAQKVCALDWDEIKEYNANLESGAAEDDHTLAQMCFRSVFVYQLIRNGWEFGDNYTITAVDEINGLKMGWALGCMLYEINTLPWDFHPELLYIGPSWWLIGLYIVLGTLAGGAVGFILAMRLSKKFNKRVRQSVFFKKSFIGKNPVLRKSLALPPLEDLDLDELSLDDEEKEALAPNGNGQGTKYT